ncbi:MAG: NADP oxidoreductase [Phycisphaerae bacterium]|nr:NADP oxidoreductase [Phycisphaerae bacterium]
MSLLDMDERLVEIIQHVDLTATPITDLKQPPAAGVDVGVLEGAVNNSSNEEVAKRMRERCRVLVAMGDCAVFGGIPTMRNRGCKQAALRRAYVESESTVDGRVPDDPELAVMQEARPLDQVVEVDVYLPGCPPPADAIYLALKELAQGRMPELKGKDLDWH